MFLHPADPAQSSNPPAQMNGNAASSPLLAEAGRDAKSSGFSQLPNGASHGVHSGYEQYAHHVSPQDAAYMGYQAYADGYPVYGVPFSYQQQQQIGDMYYNSPASARVNGSMSGRQTPQAINGDASQPLSPTSLSSPPHSHIPSHQQQFVPYQQYPHPHQQYVYPDGTIAPAPAGYYPYPSFQNPAYGQHPNSYYASFNGHSTHNGYHSGPQSGPQSPLPFGSSDSSLPAIDSLSMANGPVQNLMSQSISSLNASTPATSIIASPALGSQSNDKELKDPAIIAQAPARASPSHPTLAILSPPAVQKPLASDSSSSNVEPASAAQAAIHDAAVAEKNSTAEPVAKPVNNTVKDSQVSSKSTSATNSNAATKPAHEVRPDPSHAHSQTQSAAASASTPVVANGKPAARPSAHGPRASISSAHGSGFRGHVFGKSISRSDPSIACTFFEMGKCKYGDNCSFVHYLKTAQALPTAPGQPAQTEETVIDARLLKQSISHPNGSVSTARPWLPRGSEHGPSQNALRQSQAPGPQPNGTGAAPKLATLNAQQLNHIQSRPGPNGQANGFPQNNDRFRPTPNGQVPNGNVQRAARPGQGPFVNQPYAANGVQPNGAPRGNNIPASLGRRPAPSHNANTLRPSGPRVPSGEQDFPALAAPTSSSMDRTSSNTSSKSAASVTGKSAAAHVARENSGAGASPTTAAAESGVHSSSAAATIPGGSTDASLPPPTAKTPFSWASAAARAASLPDPPKRAPAQAKPAAATPQPVKADSVAESPLTVAMQGAVGMDVPAQGVEASSSTPTAATGTQASVAVAA